MRPGGRPLVLAVLACAAASAHGAAPAQARKPARCERRTGTTIVAGPGRRVFSTRRNVSDHGDTNTLRVFACRPHSRRPPYRLERFDNTIDALTYVQGAWLSGGRWLLVAYEEDTGTDATHFLRLYDLGRRRVLAGYAQAGAFEFDGVALTDRGAFAVLDPDHLLAFDAAGRRELAGAGASALADAGSTVYWTEGETAHSAKLGGAPGG